MVDFEAFPNRGGAHDEELTRLQRENATLKKEHDVLKWLDCCHVFPVRCLMKSVFDEVHAQPTET
jgi:hypothetical protein